MELFDFLLPLLPPTNNIEIQLYFQSSQALLAGQLPYIDFLWIYSPGLLLFMTFLTWMTKNVQVFVYFYAFILFLSWVSLWMILYRYAAKKLHYNQPLIQMISLLSFLFLGLTVNKLLINIDVFAVLLATLGLLYLLKGNFSLAACWMGLSFCLRPFVIVWLPLLFFKHPKLKNQIYQVIIFILPSLLSLLPYNFFNLTPAYINSLLFQSQRSVQIESVSASIMWFFSLIGMPIHTDITFVHQAITLHWDNQFKFLGLLLSFLMFIPLLMSYFKVFVSMKHVSTSSYVYLSGSILFMFGLLIFHPVLSPQYLIWLWMPFSLWLIESLSNKNISGKMALTLWLIFLCIHGLTSAILIYYLPGNALKMIQLDSTPMSLIAVRNGLLLILWLIIFWKFTLNYDKNQID